MLVELRDGAPAQGLGKIKSLKPLIKICAIELQFVGLDSHEVWIEECSSSQHPFFVRCNCSASFWDNNGPYLSDTVGAEMEPILSLL